jgi:hypothetical protein
MEKAKVCLLIHYCGNWQTILGNHFWKLTHHYRKVIGHWKRFTKKTSDSIKYRYNIK